MNNNLPFPNFKSPSISLSVASIINFYQPTQVKMRGIRLLIKQKGWQVQNRRISIFIRTTVHLSI